MDLYTDYNLSDVSVTVRCGSHIRKFDFPHIGHYLLMYSLQPNFGKVRPEPKDIFLITEFEYEEIAKLP